MNIDAKLRSKAISELMDDISLAMAEEGHDLPEESVMKTAEKHLDDMIQDSMKALGIGQNIAVIKEELMMQGISDAVAEALTDAMTS